MLLTSGSPHHERLLGLVYTSFRISSTSTSRTLPRGISPDSTILCLSGVGTRPFYNDRGAIVKTSAIITISGMVLNGPRGTRRTFRVLSLLSNERRSIFAKMALLRNKGDGSFFYRAGIGFCRLSGRRVGSCVTYNRYFSGTNTCKVRKGNSLFIDKVYNSCFGIIKLPISELTHRLGYL